MAEHRYSNGKNPYKPNKYKAQLNHRRAMQAGEPSGEERIEVKNDDGYFRSSRRPDRMNGGFAPSDRGISSYSSGYDLEGVSDPNGVRSAKASRGDGKKTASYSAKNGSPRRTSDSPRGSHGAGRSAAEGMPRIKNGAQRYPKHSRGAGVGKAIVITIAAVLIMGVIGFTVWQIAGDYLPASKAPADTTSATATVQATQATAAASEAAAGNTVGSGVNPLEFSTPNPTDDGSDGYLDNGLFIWNNAAYELFSADSNSAAAYAEAVNGYAKSLGDGIKTYVMVIPNHSEICLPKRFSESGEITNTSQRDNIKTIYENLDKNVTPVNCYNNLVSHGDEYIYYNTDHHWTGLGAYYAYEAFARAENMPVLDLGDCTKKTIEGFSGSLASAVSTDLPDDTVEYWEFPYETSNDIYYDSQGEPEELSVYYSGADAGSLTYGVFIWGDQPLEVLRSSNGTGKIAVVKESYGNAFVPYLTNNFSEVHVIDYRYWEGNLRDYCTENGIDRVLILNGVMSANTAVQIESMDTVF